MNPIRKSIRGFTKGLWLVAFIFCFHEGLKSQDIYHLTAVLSPSFEKISDRRIQYSLPLEWKPSYHFGFEYKGFLDPDFSFTTGIHFQNKGFRTRPRIMSLPGVIDEERTGHIRISARYLTIPFGLDKHFQIGKRTHLMASAALHGGILINQVFSGSRIDGPEDIQDPLFLGLKDEASNIDWFRRPYFAWSAGFGIVQYIKAKLVLSVQPMYQRQLNDNIDPDGPVSGTEKPRFDAIYINFKGGYYFNKQIKNYKKAL